MTTAVLAEDEPLLRDELRIALAALWPELTIVAEAGDGIAAVHAIAQHAPDVVFLDINMPQLTGLEVARAIRGTPSIVFLTAYHQHALAAFDLGAVDYLVKPLNRARLLDTVERLRARGRGVPVPPAVWDALAAPAPPATPAPKYLRWVQASVGNLLRLITTDEIIFFQADAKYTRVVTAHAEALIRKPIKELMDELNPDDFIQVSRGAIVNLRRVESIYKSDGHMEVRFRDHPTRLPVSTGFQAAFRQL
jgi:DNA-binding LytR/AlgR family response regulator